MPTDFYYPDAVNSTPRTYAQWTVSAGDKGAATQPGGGRAGPMTHDDDTTYITATLSTIKYQELSVDEPSPIGPISALTATFRHRYVSGSTPGAIRSLYFINSSGTLGTVILSINDATTSYVSETLTNALDKRPGGGSWEGADFTSAATDIRFATHYGANNNDDIVRVTSVWGQITYEPPAGGFAFLLNLAGLGALPFVGSMTDFAHFRRYLDWRRVYHPRHTRFGSRDEIMRAWHEVRAHRHPTFFLPRPRTA